MQLPLISVVTVVYNDVIRRRIPRTISFFWTYNAK
ncbi:Uncharacterised protein [Helicobacter cinaedi]|uniref:Uncharacterized protein n=1 Tax=Helicobacter cinaedi TaxID=213 RepID=A0A377JUE9_9HELI|nr:Uncharacterised protein [Helicobacter cinaedi]